MSKAPRIQLRGNCPCCGREQAIVKNCMAKHGYEVKHGWFNGVCNGEFYEPMQIRRERAETVIAQVRLDVRNLLQSVKDLKSGEKHPAQISRGNTNRISEAIDWADALEYERKRAVEQAIRALENRAKEGAAFADFMQTTLDRVYGQPLREVEIEAAPTPIQIGECRKSVSGLILRAYRVDGARVYWRATNEVSQRQGWTGTQAWRRMEIEGAE